MCNFITKQRITPGLLPVSARHTIASPVQTLYPIQIHPFPDPFLRGAPPIGFTTFFSSATPNDSWLSVSMT